MLLPEARPRGALGTWKRGIHRITENCRTSSRLTYTPKNAFLLGSVVSPGYLPPDPPPAPHHRVENSNEGLGLPPPFEQDRWGKGWDDSRRPGGPQPGFSEAEEQ